MILVVVVTFWLVNAVAAGWPDGESWPWDAAPCNCDAVSFLSKTDGENPCGCNFIKKTSRRQLTAMTNGRLEKMASGLQDEVDQLQATFDGDKKKNGETLTKLKQKLSEVKEQKQKQTIHGESATEDRQNKIDNLKQQAQDDQGKIADVDEDLKMNQMILKDVRTSLALRMQDVHACGCEKPKEESERPAFVTKNVKPYRKDDVDYKLVYKIEKLERSRAKLNKAITKEQTTFGWKSRYLMETIDKQKINIDVAGNTDTKHEALDERRLDSVKAQKENIKRTLERKTAQLKQVEKDAAETQKRYDSLEAEMKECGCEPPSDTELEMRKLQLRDL